MAELLVLFVTFAVAVFGAGPALLPAGFGSPLQRVTIGIVASLVGLYLFGFVAYWLKAPASVHWLIVALPLLVAWRRRRVVAELWSDSDVRQATFAWLAVVAWLLGWQCTIFSYSGGHWEADWFEHYQRAKFFLGHWDVHYRFFGLYSLAARPPFANIVSAEFLALAGVKFHVFQATSALLASLAVWPVCVLQRRFSGTTRSVRFGWAALLLMMLPAFVQNATFTWTKLPAAFLVLSGLALLVEREAAFPTRLAGWLSLTAAMLVHYSAGPWIVAVAVAEIARSGWRSFFDRRWVKIGAICGLLFATWIGWSVWRLGIAETFGSNSTVVDGMGITASRRLSQAVRNVYYTLVPVMFRSVEPDGYTAKDAVVRLRNVYFNSVQNSALMLAGSLGVVFAGGLLWRERRTFNREGRCYWGTLLGVGVALGIVVHTEAVPQGVAQICLLPFALLVVAWLAARAPTLGRAWQVVLAIGIAVDFALGIALHFAVQSFWLPRWLQPDLIEVEIAERLGWGTLQDLYQRGRMAESFLRDLPPAVPVAVLLAIAAGWLLWRCFRASEVGRGESPRVETSVPPPALWEARLGAVLFVAALGFWFWGVSVGWESKTLPGAESRQAQTAISAFFIKQENNFSLAYPTPLLGKPWSVPLEFPLYQWTVVLVSKATGWGITMAGRAVSLACFLLTLPAIFLLLERWRIAPARRWVILAVVVTCPFYIFFTRTVLVETMALMFGLWFWIAFERAVDRRHPGWLALAVVSGSGAGLVKATTLLLYLLPVAGWCIGRLRKLRWREAGRELTWMVVGAGLPLLACFWWVGRAEEIRRGNPLAGFLTLPRLVESTWGTPESRFDPDYWLMKWRIVTGTLDAGAVLAFCLALALLAGRRRWRAMAACGATFLAVLLLFPRPSSFDVEYYVANTVLLLIAMGLALVALLESRARRWLGWSAVSAVLLGQAAWYFHRYHDIQENLATASNALGDRLRSLTAPDEYLVIAGTDWDPATAYYAQRRAVTIRNDETGASAGAAAAWANLSGEKLGALLVTSPMGPKAWLVRWAAERGLSPAPLLVWRDVAIFLPEARRTEHLEKFATGNWPGFRPAANVKLPETPTAGEWVRRDELRPHQRALFAHMDPQPVRIFSTYGLTAEGRSGEYWFGAHPVTRLVFAVSAGPHTLRTTLRFSPGAYRWNLPEKDLTDGVDVALESLAPDGSIVTLQAVFLDPVHVPEDRTRLLNFDFQLDQPGEVQLSIGPGPDGRDSRDWVSLGPLTIR